MLVLHVSIYQPMMSHYSSSPILAGSWTTTAIPFCITTSMFGECTVCVYAPACDGSLLAQLTQHCLDHGHLQLQSFHIVKR